tara:strand:- start:26 stop:304 length:279 start_codon:yes stop_codon:yes gene_type:complete
MSKKNSLVDVIKKEFAATALEMFNERKAAAPKGTKDIIAGGYVPTEYDMKQKYMPILKDMALLMKGYGVKLSGLGKEVLDWQPKEDSFFDSE